MKYSEFIVILTYILTYYINLFSQYCKNIQKETKRKKKQYLTENYKKQKKIKKEEKTKKKLINQKLQKAKKNQKKIKKPQKKTILTKNPEKKTKKRIKRSKMYLLT